MKKKNQGWLQLITRLVLCLTAAAIAMIDALISRTGKITLNITLLAGLFIMGIILAVRGYSRLIQNNKDRKQLHLAKNP